LANKQVCKVQKKHSAKSLPSFFFALGKKELLFRVPEILHLANNLTLGKDKISGSDKKYTYVE
jgi:hypothetical protein